MTLCAFGHLHREKLLRYVSLHMQTVWAACRWSWGIVLRMKWGSCASPTESYPAFSVTLKFYQLSPCPLQVDFWAVQFNFCTSKWANAVWTQCEVSSVYPQNMQLKPVDGLLYFGNMESELLRHTCRPQPPVILEPCGVFSLHSTNGLISSCSVKNLLSAFFKTQPSHHLW